MTNGALIAVACAICTLALIEFGLPRLVRRMRGDPLPGQVFGSLGHLKAAALMLLVLTGLASAALVFAKPFDTEQLLIWLSMAGAIVLALGCFLNFGWRIRATFDRDHMIYRTWLGRTQTYLWSELKMRRSPYGAAVAFKAKGMDEIGFSGDEPGLPELMIAAFEAGVEGAELFVRRL
ncbi:MAG: hypothetical protein KJ824_10030 [Alphaproteobacteria bacterium]|nr:hypothetical protein [Alphaproteobacteria bacterium]